MSQINIPVGSTTLILNGSLIPDLISGDVLVLTPVNAFSSQVNSTNGVNIIGRADADVHDLTINAQKYSESDVILSQFCRTGGNVPVINGSMKTAYQRNGVDGMESWTLEAGSVLTRPTDTKNDVDGNAVMQYVIRFRFATRNL